MPRRPGRRLGRCWGYLEWQELVAELEEIANLADMLDEAPAWARWEELPDCRRLHVLCFCATVPHLYPM